MLRRLLLLAGAAGTAVVLTGCVLITPNTGLADGQVVSVAVSQFTPGSRVWLSECAPSQVPNAGTGCSSSLSGEPSVVVDRNGNGTVPFAVRRTVGGVACGPYCTVVATDAHRLQTASIGFSGPGQLAIGNGLAARPVDLYSDGQKIGTVESIGSAPAVTLPAGTHQVALRTAGAAPTSTPLAAGVAQVASGARTSSVGRLTVGSTAVTSTEAPPPPPAGMLRVRWVNESTTPLTVILAGHPGPTLAPGQSTDITEPGDPNVPPGDDNFAAEYPSPIPGQPTCGMGDAGGLGRGVGEVVTLTYQPDLPSNRECPHNFDMVVG